MTGQSGQFSSESASWWCAIGSVVAEEDATCTLWAAEDVWVDGPRGVGEQSVSEMCISNSYFGQNGHVQPRSVIHASQWSGRVRLCGRRDADWVQEGASPSTAAPDLLTVKFT